MKRLSFVILSLALASNFYSAYSAETEEAESNEVPDFKVDEEESYDGLEFDEDHDVYKRYFLKRQATNEFRQKALELHNMYRAKHGSPPLKLDDQLNKDAQAYAEEESKSNVQKHSCGPCDKYGENLAYKAGTAGVPEGLDAAEWACKSWYDEVSLYNFNKPGGGDMHKWGHFTALIWKSTTKMGIGIAYGSKLSKSGNKMKTVYVVARYLPPGNMLTPEAMKENVLPPK